MWRSMFLAAGIVICVLGAECLIMEKAVLASDKPIVEETASLFGAASMESPSEIKPPEWAPWSLLSTGAVVILYSYSIPRRNSG